MRWRDRIISNRRILNGRPVVNGTKIAVDLIFDLLGMGWSYAKVLRLCPALKKDDLRACMSYAADALRTGSPLLQASQQQAAGNARLKKRYGCDAGFERELRDIRLIREARYELQKTWTPKQLCAYCRQSTKQTAEEFGLRSVRRRRRRRVVETIVREATR